jgi:predicted nucleotidyltransferase
LTRPTCRRSCGAWSRDGLFESEVSGRQKYFHLNRAYPLFQEVRGIVTKTVGAVPLLAQSLKRIDGIEEAYLYGSFARNQQDAASDIDVLVIGTPGDRALAEAVRRLERQFGRDINYTVLTRKEFEARRAQTDTFLEGVWHNKRVSLVAAHGRRRSRPRPPGSAGRAGAAAALGHPGRDEPSS